MAVNVRVLQAAVAAAVVDPQYQQLLMTDRTRAVSLLPEQPCMPPVHLTAEDRDAFFRLPTSSFAALAHGVWQLELAQRLQARSANAEAQPAETRSMAAQAS